MSTAEELPDADPLPAPLQRKKLGMPAPRQAHARVGVLQGGREGCAVFQAQRPNRGDGRRPDRRIFVIEQPADLRRGLLAEALALQQGHDLGRKLWFSTAT